MPTLRFDWPLTLPALHRAISDGESTLVEFKGSWWQGSDDMRAKAQFARAVMAMANSVGVDEMGLVLVGVDDERRGSSILGVKTPPSAEAVVGVLGQFIHPPPRIDCKSFEIDGKQVSAIGVFHSGARPHYPIREYSEVLSMDKVYVRRGKRVGHLTVPELELMIRAKDAALGPIRSRDPLLVGFVSLDEGSPKRAVLRLQNLLEERLVDVTVSFDLFLMRDPTLCSRFQKLSGAIVEPGGVLEVAAHSQELRSQFYKVIWCLDQASGRSGQLVRHHQSATDTNLVGETWYDLIAHVTYRDSDGLIRCVDVPATVTW